MIGCRRWSPADRVGGGRLCGRIAATVCAGGRTTNFKGAFRTVFTMFNESETRLHVALIVNSNEQMQNDNICSLLCQDQRPTALSSLLK